MSEAHVEGLPQKIYCRVGRMVFPLVCNRLRLQGSSGLQMKPFSSGRSITYFPSAVEPMNEKSAMR